MGREVKRVHMDFKWPIRKAWPGYVNPLYEMYSYKCDCENGYSEYGYKMFSKWYGYIPFDPSETGSKSYTPDNESIMLLAQRNYKGKHESVIRAEAERLATLFNGQWCHHLSQEDVDALIEEERLHHFTHTWQEGTGWVKKENVVITAQEVNQWSLTGMGHDSINCGICVRARCKRDGKESYCKKCGGYGTVYYSDEYKKMCEDFVKYDPPVGEGYQIWEDVSEGSPVSPVFAKPEDLAKWMVDNDDSIYSDTTYEEWLKFIDKEGYAISMVGSSNGLVNGVKALSQRN